MVHSQAEGVSQQRRVNYCCTLTPPPMYVLLARHVGAPPGLSRTHMSSHSLVEKPKLLVSKPPTYKYCTRSLERSTSPASDGSARQRVLIGWCRHVIWEPLTTGVMMTPGNAGSFCTHRHRRGQQPKLWRDEADVCFC